MEAMAMLLGKAVLSSRLSKCVVVFGKRLLSRAAPCLRAGAALLLALALSGNTTHAANRTWDGGGANNNWLTVTNWDGNLTAPSANDLLFFAGTTRLTTTNNFAANTAFNGLTFNSGAGAFTLWGNAVNLGGGVTNNSTSLQTINLNLALTATRNIEVVSAGSLTIGGVVSGTGFGLTKSGAGTLTLNGANTFSGGMTILQGTVSVGTIANAGIAQPLGAVSSVTLGSSGQNATLQYSGASATTTMPFILAAGGTGTFQIDNAATVLTRTVAITGSGGLIKSGAGTLQTDSIADSYSGNTVLNAGILRVSYNSNPNTTYYLNGGILVDDSGIFDRPIIVTADGSGLDGVNGRWLTGTLTSSGGNYTLNVNTSSIANSLTMMGTVTAGEGLTLLLDVQKGSLILNNSTAFAANTVSLQLESAATLDMNKFNATFGALSGSGTVSDNAGGGGATTVLTLGGTNSATFSGVIENGTKTTALVRSNTGIQTLSGASTFTGGTTIKGGTILIGVSNVGTTSGALGPSTAAVTLGDTTGSANASLLTAGAFTFANAVTVAAGSSGTATLGGSTADASIFTGNITLNKSAILTAVNGGNATFSGVISGIGSGITKTDAGTVTLSGANTFGGVLTVSAGTVSISTINNASVAGVLGNSANAVVLGASGATGTLQYTGATASSTKPFTMAAGGTGVFQVDSSGTTLTLSGAVGGSGALTKTGAGTLTFSGSANTFSGVTTVNEGTLVLGKAAGTTSVAGALTIGDGSGTDTVRLNAANQIADTSAVSINTGGVLDLSGNSDTIASLAMTAGSVTAGTGTLTLGGNVAGNAAATSATISGNLSLGTSVRTFTIADGVATDDMVISAVISGGAGNGLTKAGAGTLTLSGANTFNGALTVSGGTLRLGAANVIPNGAGNGSLSVDGTFDLGGFNEVINGLSGAGTVDNAAGSGSYTLTVGDNNQTSVFSGIIKNTSGTVALTKIGTGTLTLSGTNTYSGTTTVTVGKIKVQNNAALGNASGATTIASGAAIQIDGNGLLIGENISLAGDGGGSGALQSLALDNGWSGDISFADDARVNSDSGTLTLSGGITGAGHAATFGGAGNIAASGIISGSGTSVIYDGSGVLTLSGVNLYTGDTTVKSGTLVVGANAPSGSAGALGSATSAVLVGGVSGSSAASLFIGGAFTMGRNITVQSGSSGTATLGGNTADVSTFSGNIALNKNAILTAASAANVTFSGIISGSGGITKTGSGTVTLGSANTYTGGTTLSQGTLKLGANDSLGTGGFTFAGGILDANNMSDSTIGALSLTASSTLNLHAGGAAGSLTFSSASWTAGTLTINGWSGSAGGAGTDDRIFITADPTASGVLGQIQFTGYAPGANWVGATGEIVPVPEPTTVALGVFGAVVVLFGFGRRLYSRANNALP